MKTRLAKPLDVLAIAAHPDDAELTCGGTLIQCVRRGYRVGVLDLTRGELGTRGTPERRAREARAAARVLGVEHRENLGLPDARLSPTLEVKLAVAARLRVLRPRLVILPYWEARHPDHYHASAIGYEACWLAGLKKLELAAPPHRPSKILYATMYDPGLRKRPSFVVDITREFARRQRAISCYRSQFRNPTRVGRVHIPLSSLPEMVASLSRYYGILIGVRYGEPFATRELLQIEDILHLPVRSI